MIKFDYQFEKVLKKKRFATLLERAVGYMYIEINGRLYKKSEQPNYSPFLSKSIARVF